MRTHLLTRAGAAAVVLGGVLFLPGTVAAATTTAPAATSDFIAILAPVADSGPNASGEAWVSLTGNTAKFTVQVSGLAAGAAHLSQVYVGSAGQCSPEPTGTVGAALTIAGDTSAGSAGATTRYPTAAAYTYSRTFAVDPAVTAGVRNGTATLVVTDAAGGAAKPALCGAFVASQMVATPAGSADTGGGSAAAVSHPGLFSLGIATLLAAAAATLVALRRRHAAPSVEVVVTNGFRRMIR